jgi:hypothetical protein
MKTETTLIQKRIREIIREQIAHQVKIQILEAERVALMRLVIASKKARTKRA